MKPSKSKTQQVLAGQRQQLQVAWNFYRLGLMADAESICHELMQDSLKNPGVLHLLGTIFLHYGKAEEAVESLKSAISAGSNNPESFGNLGLAYHEQGLLTEAIRQYLRAIDAHQHYADAYYNLHAAQLDVENTQAAMASLKKVLGINPADADASFMLALLLDFSGLPEQAQPYFGSASKQSRLYQSRLDAWQYLKGRSNTQHPVMGSSIQVFKHALSHANTDGLVLEFGVRFGTSIRVLSKLVEHVDGFDSFEGLPDEWHHEPKGSYTTKGVIPKVPANVALHAGWFADTLPQFLAEHDGPVRFVNVDCDIYSSTKTVLELLAPRIVVGSVIVFDEYIGNEHWREDEFKAFQEAVSRYGWQYEYLCFSFFTKQVAVKIIGI